MENKEGLYTITWADIDGTEFKESFETAIDLEEFMKFDDPEKCPHNHTHPRLGYENAIIGEYCTQCCSDLDNYGQLIKNKNKSMNLYAVAVTNMNGDLNHSLYKASSIKEASIKMLKTLAFGKEEMEHIETLSFKDIGTYLLEECDSQISTLKINSYE